MEGYDTDSSFCDVIGQIFLSKMAPGLYNVILYNFMKSSHRYFPGGYPVVQIMMK